MADDRDPSQQTEEPTQKRLDEAREHGDAVKSPEVQTLVLLLGGTLAISVFGQSAALGFARTFRLLLAEPDRIGIGPGELLDLMRDLMGQLVLILGPIFALLMVTGVAGNVLQHRPTLAFDKIKPNLSKLSPLASFKRLFGIDGLANLFKGILKMAIVGTAVWTQLWPEHAGLEAVLQQSAAGIAGEMTHLLIKVLVAALAAMAFIAGADYMLQRSQFLKRNRMSKHDIKEEYRQTEGDPMIKARIRQIRKERAKRRMIAAVPEATVVIVNPTHFAVALKYVSGKMAAPVCVAKGVDALALRIREVAEDHGVPVVENPPLARALHAVVKVDEVIPTEHYKAVAQVIGYVLRLTGKLKAN
jgi:flagellar biosynthetic protein FlhB